MYVYIRRWHDDFAVTSEVFSKNVNRVSFWKSEKKADFGDCLEDLMNVVVWLDDGRTISYNDCIDCEVM